MSKQKLIIIFALSIYIIVSGCKGMNKPEITAEEATRIATNVAKEKNYDTQKADVEVLKVKKKIERGPIRLVWLMRNFRDVERKLLFDNEYWIVYFYTKGLLENPVYLDGDFCVLVDLYSGKVIASFAMM